MGMLWENKITGEELEKCLCGILLVFYSTLQILVTILFLILSYLFVILKDSNMIKSLELLSSKGGMLSL